MMSRSDLMILLMVRKTLTVNPISTNCDQQGATAANTEMTSSNNLVSRHDQAELMDELLPGLQLGPQAPPGLGRFPLPGEKRLSWP